MSTHTQPFAHRAAPASPIRRAGRPLSQPVPGRVRLLCLPPAGAGASLYYPWLDAAPDWLDVCPVAMPGREDLLSEAPPESLPALAEHLSHALLPALDGPFAILGYSMGAFIAHELVQRWQARGLRGPQAFFALAARSPTAPFDREQPMHRLDGPGFRQALIDMGGTPRAILDNEEAMALFEPILRNDLRISETYRPAKDRRPMACPVHAIFSPGDALMDEAHVQAWSDCAGGGLTLHRITGPHMLARQDFLNVLGKVAALIRP